jgi:hypothetical protein
MGAAFVTRRGIGGSNRLERVAPTSSGNGYITWGNLALSTNTYFLSAWSLDTNTWVDDSYLEAIIEDGKVEVLRGYDHSFSINIGETSISISATYSNTTISSSHTELYRFC